jgi:CRISPR-associated protein Cmr6
MIPVNSELQAILRAMPAIENHGLLLDKYHEQHQGQEKDKPELVKVASLRPNDGLLARMSQEREAALDALEAKRWLRKTCGPLTLQLSRAGTFENAGICLHPVYGFVYLPGTGVKGVARAYAETVAKAPAAEFKAVFGSEVDDEASGGTVVFHDAWPAKWPRLVVDIVNNHHAKYYQGTDRNPPEDFENPIPVTFLAVEEGCEFAFAVGPRQGSGCNPALLEKAKAWLDGALNLLGAGAKTNAGYGRFAATGPLEMGADFAQFSCTVTLETPAFLAGANQKAEDCDLRPATMRGLLRWWWRTLHSGYLTVNDFRKKEAEVWGDTNAGGAVALQVEAANGPFAPQTHDPGQLARVLRLQTPPDHKTAQGVLYASYGMQGSRDKAARQYLPPGASWTVILIARKREALPARDVLEHAVLALWMLCHFGGAGAKARRGFGSLKHSGVAEMWPRDLNDVTTRSANLRGPVTKKPVPIASSVEHLQARELQLPGNEPWFALDQLGYAYQAFCKLYKRRPQKWALGLPRRTQIVQQNLTADERRYPLIDRKFARFALPLHFHVFRDGQGYWVRIAAFASPQLPDLNTSRTFLAECVAKMREELAERMRTVRPPVPAPVRAAPTPRTSAPVRMAPAAVSGPRSGTATTGVLLEKNAKGTWKVRVEGFLEAGSIPNSKEMPGSLQPGETVRLKVRSTNPKNLSFDWIKEK